MTGRLAAALLAVCLAGAAGEGDGQHGDREAAGHRGSRRRWASVAATASM